VHEFLAHADGMGRNQERKPAMRCALGDGFPHVRACASLPTILVSVSQSS
jgi:hypothetical protein